MAANGWRFTIPTASDGWDLTTPTTTLTPNTGDIDTRVTLLEEKHYKLEDTAIVICELQIYNALTRSRTTRQFARSKESSIQETVKALTEQVQSLQASICWVLVGRIIK